MNIDFTHKGLTIQDIKKIKKNDFYKIKFKELDEILSVSAISLEYRLCGYFMKDSINFISRDEILSCKYNINVTTGHYLRIEDGKLKHFTSRHSKKPYINFISIDSEIDNIEGPFFTKYEMSSATDKDELPF
jgi:hypothetical protein